MDEGSACSKDVCLTNAQLSPETDIHAPGWIRIHNAGKRETADPRLRPRDYRNRPIGDFNGKLRREVFVTVC